MKQKLELISVKRCDVERSTDLLAPDLTRGIEVDSGLVPTLPGAIELEVPKAVRSMLQDASGKLQVEVLALNIGSVGVADINLSARFDFKVSGR